MDTLRAWAEIDLAALRYNYEYGKHLAGGRPVMPVIKGDAHGHGAVVFGRYMERLGAAAFAVACLSEAVSLRETGISKPILILGWTDPSCAPELLKYDITQSAFDLDYAKALSNALADMNASVSAGDDSRAANDSAAGASARLKVHAKVDTGMTRTGISAQKDPKAAADTILAVAALPNLELTGIFTHYAVADVPEKEAFTAWQLSNFQKALAALTEKGFDLSKVTVHASNSAVIMYHPESHFDMVRMGVMMYGMYPSDDYENHGELRPVLTLKARVAQVKDIAEGACISYGCTFTAPKPMRIAVVTAGYADSYPRALSGKGAWAMIAGHKCAQIGRICMDMCMFDVTGTDVKAGDEVILYGEGGMSHEDIAHMAGSMNCEHTCLLPERVKKVYINTEE